MSRPNILEEFQLELREIVQTAARVKGLRLPDMPINASVKVAAELVLALAPFDSQFPKALAEMWRSCDQETETFVEMK